jgi:hypothetical protein
MTAPDEKPRRSPPKELIGIAGFTLAIFLVVLAGATIVGRFEHPSPWIFAAAYAIPSGIAFSLYWFIARRL